MADPTPPFDTPATRLSTAGVTARIRELGLELPVPPAPAGSYVPVRLHEGVGWVSAQVPVRGGRVEYAGRVGDELTPEQGRAAAELAALNTLARIHEALGGFDRLRGLLRVEGHVASADEFRDQPAVLDGASDLFRKVLGEAGVHARSAFGPPSLPWDCAVELVVTFSYYPERP